MYKWATPEGTDKYFKWVSVHASKQRQFDGLTVSALGAGTYLGPSDDLTDKLYEQALVQAGLGGVNFFDTAISYRNQRSEKILGKAIRDLADRGVNREQIVIATKGGYLPFEGSFEDYVRSHYLDTGIIEMKDIVAESHCMTPAFLENQIASSLKHLGLQSIDLYYLHNPETQLHEVGEEEFYRRLKAAFTLFEQKVQEKKIRRYGISTWNGFRIKKGGLQLSKIIKCAKDVGGTDHHFKAIQLPYNLVMLEAIKEKKLFETAKENHIAIMASASLMQGRLKQLPKRLFEELPKGKAPMVQALEFVLSTPGICTGFCGMKKLEHWAENANVFQEPNWTPEDWNNACISLGLPIIEE
jgi:aryl-alcohol dehydrogenase-like predicted oxidoreductase